MFKGQFLSQHKDYHILQHIILADFYGDTSFQIPESAIPIVRISLSYMLYSGLMVKIEVPNFLFYNVGFSIEMFKCSNFKLVENI